MTESKRSGGGVFWWIVLGIWFFASLGGIFYSFRFLISAIFCFIVAFCARPRDKKMNDGWVALQKVWAWEKTGGPMLPEEVFRTAAQWYMYNVNSIRSEDLRTWKGIGIPGNVKPFIKSEKELRRSKGVIF